ncbi:MAG: HD-GYP domain-containing protein [Arenicellales bacterium]
MAAVLIIDDQATSRQILSQIVKSIDSCLLVKAFEEAQGALDWLEQSPADLILTDYKMPRMDGIEFLRLARSLPTAKHVPIIMITSHEQTDIRHKALELGATDFLNKPIDHNECRARFRNLLQLQQQRLIIEDRANWLEQKVAEATHAIHIREHETLLRLGKAGEYRDEETGNHVIRMAKYSRLIAMQLGLHEDERETIEMAAPMHDIGKIGVPDQILLKPGRLSVAEFTIIKQHTNIGYEILKDSPSKYLQMGAVIALGHHEKFNGSGYPQGLREDDIPLVARIVAVADVYDALSSKRCYKPAWSHDDVLNTLNEQSGQHFDPRCVQAFISQLEEVQSIQARFSDEHSSA